MVTPFVYDAQFEEKLADRETGKTLGVNVEQRQVNVADSISLVVDEKSASDELSTLNIMPRISVYTTENYLLNPTQRMQRCTLSIKLDFNSVNFVNSNDQNQVSTNSCRVCKKRPADIQLGDEVKRRKVEVVEEQHICNYEVDGVCECDPIIIEANFYVPIFEHPRVAHISTHLN